MRLLTREQLAAEKGIALKRMQLWRLVTRGDFPKPVKQGIGSRAHNSWIESEIDAWLKKKARERFAKSGEAA